MWMPTHIKVTVQRAKGLLTKGKNGTNNCFVTIGLGKEKYQTSVKEKAEPNVNWNEECELKIPDQGNRAELMLTCLHRNNLSIDEFLGQVTLPLNEMDVYDQPRSKWYKLESKPGKEKKNKERGELEVRVSFHVKSGSLTDLSKKEKHKSSIGQLASSVGGSLLSIGQIEKRKGIKKFAKSLGSKMHLHSKKKNKDGDDISYNGSLASLGTPNSSNGGGRRNGQRAGEADPGVISEDEDEFVFDNLSHKSSGSSLNVRAASGLQPPTQNFTPRNPSPLLLGQIGGRNGSGKAGGKQLAPAEEDSVVDPELMELENDFSVRARTLPPPSKPPRTPQLGDKTAADKEQQQQDEQLNEWEKKLYGKHMEIGKGDSLKRRSWETRVPLPTAKEEERMVEAQEDVVEVAVAKKEVKKVAIIEDSKAGYSSSSSSSSAQSDVDEEGNVAEPKTASSRPQALNLNAQRKVSLLSPDEEKNDFQQFNASFAKFEQRNSSKIFENDMDFNENKKWSSQALIAEETQSRNVPQAMPRNRAQEAELKRVQEEEEAKAKRQLEAEAEGAAAAAAALRRQAEEEAQQLRAAEDARLEEELRLNEQRLREEEAALHEELRQQDEQKRREAKRREEDERILSFAKRPSVTSTTSSSGTTSTQQNIEDGGEQSATTTPELSPKERVSEREQRERRLGKFKYFNKRDKMDDENSSPRSNERIIIGHEKSLSHADRRAEISAALSKKYEGKSREELMLIANGMENEALLQRQRVKELEDYLDNLLLRVMETHPKILQNPYSRTTSAKSFKNYINMNDFL